MEPLPPTGGVWPEGPAPPPEDPTETRLRGAVIAVAVVVTLLAVVLVAIVVLGGDDDGDVAVADDTTTSSSAPVTLPTTTASTVPPTTAPPSTTTTTAPVPAQLVVETGGIDFGTDGTGSEVRFRNDGGLELRYTITTTNPRLLVDSRSGSLAPGAAMAVPVRFDRDASPEGPLAGGVVVDAGEAGNATVVATGSVMRPPAISEVATSEPAFHAACDRRDDRVQVTARVVDDSGVNEVRLFWQSPENGDGSAPMQAADDRAAADLGPFAVPGIVRYTVVATDVYGNQAVAPPIDIEVLPCE